MSLVGENIDAYCLKCRLTLAHIVLYEVGGVVSQVKCKTCGAEHKYRGAKPSAPRREAGSGTTREKKPKAPPRNPSAEAAALWEERKQSLDPETPVKAYRMQEGYEIRDVIRHPVFGLGFVERVFSDRRMDVLFEGAVKSLAMNMP